MNWPERMDAAERALETMPRMSARELANKLGLSERTDDYTDRPHADLWSGSGTLWWAESGYVLENVLPEGARLVEKWSDGFRIVWAIDSERAHVTYCEGDVSVLIARSDEDYAAINVSAERFYR